VSGGRGREGRRCGGDVERGVRRGITSPSPKPNCSPPPVNRNGKKKEEKRLQPLSVRGRRQRKKKRDDAIRDQRKKKSAYIRYGQTVQRKKRKKIQPFGQKRHAPHGKEAHSNQILLKEHKKGDAPGGKGPGLQAASAASERRKKKKTFVTMCSV